MRHLDDGTLQAWLDEERGGLTAPERDDIARHLAACDACAARLDALAALDDRARALLGAEGVGAGEIPDFEQVVARAQAGAGGGSAAQEPQGRRLVWAARAWPGWKAGAGRRRSPWTAAAWAAMVVLAVGVGWLARGALHRGAAVATGRVGEPAPMPAVMAAAPPVGKPKAAAGAPAATSQAQANEAGRLAAVEPRAKVAAAAPAPIPSVPANGDAALKKEGARSAAEASPSAAAFAPAPSMQAAKAVAGEPAPVTLRADVRPSPDSRPETYRSAAIDANGNLAIVTDSGASITIRKEGDQTSFAAPAISSSRTAVGAQAMFPSCCTSYDLPLQLVVYAAGRVHRFAGDSLPIFQWAFVDGGARVGYGQQPAHFGCSTHYELRDVESERLIDAVDVPEPCGQDPHPKAVKTPAWVAEVVAKK